MDRILEFKNIYKNYGSLRVLEETSLMVKDNEIVCLLGPSGSGKTTLFKIAGNLFKLNGGKFK